MQQTDLSKARARQMRQDMTPAERAVWSALRNRRFMGLKLRRHVPIGPYIADFYCADRRLIIEVDAGGSQDPSRDPWLATQGFRVLCLCRHDILTDLSGSLDRIAADISRLPHPIDRPPPI
jgi:very-short-patch-repair endonuclease